MYKLTEDEKEDLDIILELEGFKVLINKVIPKIRQQQVDRLLSVTDEELTKERAILLGLDKLASKIKELNQVGKQAKPK